MITRIKKNVFFRFRDGTMRLVKLVEMNDGSIKIATINALHEWSLHPDRFHMKKKKIECWTENIEIRRDYFECSCGHKGWGKPYEISLDRPPQPNKVKTNTKNPNGFDSQF